MIQALTREEYVKTDDGIVAVSELATMTSGDVFNTQETEAFTLRHLEYLARHRNIKPATYIANLKVMTRFKR